MTKVCLLPHIQTVEENTGIGRVLHAQVRHLPKFDIELVGAAASADVVAGHTWDHGVANAAVIHNHGFYWLGDVGSGKYSTWHADINTRMIDSLRRARAITVPSEWVAMPFRRDMRVNPAVIGHGLELAQWAPGENGGYVLWNKNRGGDVCDPTPAWALAERGVRVVSTFAPDGKRSNNLRVTGSLKAPEMHTLIQNADVYLATTKETFGIGTLEALASGVPVLGFDWGGTADLIQHQVNGYLVPPGDYDALLEGLAYIRAHRAELSNAARESAQAYAWPRVIERYAQLYHDLVRTPEPDGVAVVIPAYNYGRYLAACIESVLAQSVKVDEIVVVDDGSTDDTLAVARRFEAQGVRVLHQANSGVATARNHGIAATSSAFVVCLDADDALAPRYVEACRDALRADRGLGLAFTGLLWERPGRAPEAAWRVPRFDWTFQATAAVPPHTMVPTGAMFRRALWERSGGYRQQYAPGEDAEFYTRGLSVGFTARQVTDSPWFIYRDHGNGAHRARPYVPIDDYLPWMRDHQYPLGAPAEVAPPVRSYSEPKVSVIIPVGPGHAQYLPTALDSLVGQTMREWEVIVVNDTRPEEDGLDWALGPYPFATVIDTREGGAQGAGFARNVGLDAARAPLVLWLDADDYLAPEALFVLCRAYAESEGRYVYGDWREVQGREAHDRASADYDPAAWLAFDQPPAGHVVTVLMATDDARRVGGFDEDLSAWEDWDFFAKCALAGVWGRRVPTVTLNVRRDTSERTARAFAEKDALLATLRQRYGGREMAKSCCGGNGAAILAAKAAYANTPRPANPLSVRTTTRGRGALAVIQTKNSDSLDPVRMEFVGQRSGAVTYQGEAGSGRQYRGGNNAAHRYINAHPNDVAALERTGMWRRVAAVLTLGVPSAPVETKPETPAPSTGNGEKAEAVRDETPLSAEAEGRPPDPVDAALERVAAAATVVEAAKPIQTADGAVRRKRTVVKGKSTPLKDV
jgi:glycosyltransferase involved in cell wall biosynthesis